MHPSIQWACCWTSHACAMSWSSATFACPQVERKYLCSAGTAFSKVWLEAWTWRLALVPHSARTKMDTPAGGTFGWRLTAVMEREGKQSIDQRFWTECVGTCAEPVNTAWISNLQLIQMWCQSTGRHALRTWGLSWTEFQWYGDYLSCTCKMRCVFT
jgi:hypothetical protein